MPVYLRQSTASQELPLGYFVDSTDGVTAETGLTIANTDIRVWKTGATTLADKNSGGATHISGGVYYCVLDATDTDTIGPLVVFVSVSGALPVRVECVVLDEAVYDVLFGTTALASATNITAAAGCAVSSIGNGVITAASIAADAGTKIATAVWASGTRTLTSLSGLTVDTVTTLTNLPAITTNWLTAAGLASDAVAEIQSGLSTLDAAGVRSAVGLASANLDTQLAAIDDYLDTEVAAIKAKTDLIPADPADASDIPTAAANADALLARNIAGGSSTGRTVGQALAALRNKVAISGGTMTVYSTDDLTPLWTAAVTSDAAADPITAVDPVG